MNNLSTGRMLLRQPDVITKSCQVTVCMYISSTPAGIQYELGLSVEEGGEGCEGTGKGGGEGGGCEG